MLTCTPTRLQVEDIVPSEFKRGFQCFAQQQARYLVGVGWKRKAYITGIRSDRGYDRLVHHGASCPAWDAPCPPDMQGSNAKDYNNLIGGLIWAPFVRLHANLSVACCSVLAVPPPGRLCTCSACALAAPVVILRCVRAVSR
jgi:hypothetical protein